MARTYAQIKDEIAALEHEAEELKRVEMDGVIERIKVAIQHYGITVDQVFDNATSRQAAASSVKYADGNGNIWSGRGPRPRWLRLALDAGVSLEALACEPGSPRAIAPPPRPRKFNRPPSTRIYSDGAGHTWTGRGPMPRWLKEATASTGDISKFLKT